MGGGDRSTRPGRTRVAPRRSEGRRSAVEVRFTAADLCAHGRATVHLREHWLEFLLGAAPRIGAYGLADAPPQLLPPAFAEALRIDLGPRVSQRAWNSDSGAVQIEGAAVLDISTRSCGTGCRCAGCSPSICRHARAASVAASSPSPWTQPSRARCLRRSNCCAPRLRHLADQPDTRQMWVLGDEVEPELRDLLVEAPSSCSTSPYQSTTRAR